MNLGRPRRGSARSDVGLRDTGLLIHADADQDALFVVAVVALDLDEALRDGPLPGLIDCGLMHFFTFSTYPRKVLGVLRYLGPWRTLLVVLLKPVEIVLRFVTDTAWYIEFSESQFDRRHGVDTMEEVPVAELNLPKDRHAGAVHYEGIRMTELPVLIESLDVDLREHVFVDLGSGKGRAVMMAAAFPFRRVLGIELAEDLHEIAQDNLRRYDGPRRCRTIEVRHGDAVDCDFPVEDSVLFLCNPFSPSLLRQMLDNLSDSLVRHPRNVVVIYARMGAEHREVLSSHPILQPLVAEPIPWAAIYQASTDAETDG